MDEFYMLNKNLYLAFTVICMFMSWMIFYRLNKDNARKKYLSILPLYYTFLTCLGFVSLLLVSFKGWIFGLLVGIMWVLILVLTIKTYKLAKYKQVFNVTAVRKKYILDMILYFVFFGLGL